ncbi:hypothetical protein QJQ45_000542 [Haematococcus lacustris]|nr:hypothetical protein QJQ45_000542 [Haematococcus lacustris]
MAEVSMERHGRAKQLVVFFGAASIGTRGGAPRKPPQAPCSSQAATPAAASEPGPSTPPPAKRSKRTKAEQAVEAKGKAAKAKPAPQPGRWLQRTIEHATHWGEQVAAAGAVLVARAGKAVSQGQGVPWPGVIMETADVMYTSKVEHAMHAATPAEARVVGLFHSGTGRLEFHKTRLLADAVKYHGLSVKINMLQLAA